MTSGRGEPEAVTRRFQDCPHPGTVNDAGNVVTRFRAPDRVGIERDGHQ
jgi:hypothetical protein